MTQYNYHKKIICIVAFFAITISFNLLKAQKSRGVIAYPFIKTLYQNDGSKLVLYVKGDAVINWYETVNGEKVIKLKNGRFVYAKIDSIGNMVASNESLLQKKPFIKRLFSYSSKNRNKNIFFSNQQIKEKENNYFKSTYISNINRQRASSTTTRSHGFPTTGKRNMLTILAEFSDTPHILSHTRMLNMMNQKGFNKSGSFRDYYYESSYGNLDITTNVTMWVKLPHTKAYYGANNSNGEDVNAREFIKDAVNAVMDVGIVFSKYDNDKDGYIDFLQVIHSGVGEESGEDSDAIWSHQWNLNGYIETNDGTKITEYFTSPELLTYKDNTPSNIGVICHEFGHALGLSDYYDTDYSGSGGYADGLGSWDLMDTGCWNNEGRYPAHTNAYSKYLLGWLNLKELNKSSEIEIKEIVNNKDAYIIKTNREQEFFVLENRQRTQFDKFLPYHGLLVYHVNRASKGWINNKVNVDPNKEALKLLQSKSYGKECPFPGKEEITYLTDVSYPSNLLTYSSDYSHKALINIKEENELIKFIFYNDNRLSHKLELSVHNDNSPIDNAQINIIRDDNSTNPISAIYTDKEGFVGVNNIIKGSYTITISKNGYKQLQKKINVYEDETIDTKLERQYNLTVKITNNSKAIENAKVKITQEANDDFRINDQITNLAGEVIFENIDFGTYTISVDKYNYEKISKSFLINKEEKLNIKIRAFNLNDILKKEIKLYPNPTDGQVTLEVELSDEAIIFLFDIRGAKVYEEKYQKGMLHHLNFGNMSSGVYNLIIIDKSTKLSKRLIIN